MVIAEARLAATDRAGVARAEASPGAILAPVFGFREVDVAGPVQGSIAGAPFSGGFLSQEIELLPGAEVLERTADGRPLLIANRYGAGATLYLTCHAGEVWREQLPAAVTAWFAARLQAAAPAAPRITCDGLLHGAVHQHGTTRLAYLVSWSDAPLHAIISSIPVASVQILDGGRLPVEAGSVRIEVPPRSAVLVTWEVS